MHLLRQLLVLAVIGAVAGGGWWWYEHGEAGGETGAGAATPRPERTARVEVVRAERRELPVAVEAVGTTRALRSVDIVPMAEGRIVAIDVTAGAEVEAGAVLARLDDEVERAALAEAEARLDEKRLAMDRARTLRQSNTISQANLEQLRSELAIAEASVERARRHLADRTVRAPFAGVLGITDVAEGARVDTGTLLTTLDDLSQVEIEFRLPESVYGAIRLEQPVTARAAAFPGRRFAGTVAAIDSRVDQASRAFRVRARLPNPDRALPVGMFMRLELTLQSREAVVVPEEALTVEAGTVFLYVAADGRAARRAVETGTRRAGLVEIVDGVAAGELVVHRGVQSVRDGRPVEIVGDGPPPPPDEPASAPRDTVASDGPRPRT